jgi:hypothetical protein
MPIFKPGQPNDNLFATPAHEYAGFVSTLSVNGLALGDVLVGNTLNLNRASAAMGVGTADILNHNQVRSDRTIADITGATRIVVYSTHR